MVLWRRGRGERLIRRLRRPASTCGRRGRMSFTERELWAIIHGFFSWLYVIYFALFK